LPPQTKLTDVGVVEAGEDAELSFAALGVVDAGLAAVGGALGAVGAGVGAEVTDVAAAGSIVSGGALDAGGSVATGEAGIQAGAGVVGDVGAVGVLAARRADIHVAEGSCGLGALARVQTSHARVHGGAVGSIRRTGAVARLDAGDAGIVYAESLVACPVARDSRVRVAHRGRVRGGVFGGDAVVAGVARYAGRGHQAARAKAAPLRGKRGGTAWLVAAGREQEQREGQR